MDNRLAGSTVTDVPGSLLDILGGDVTVDCSADGKVLWVNRNGVCILRISGMYSFVADEHLDAFSNS